MTKNTLLVSLALLACSPLGAQHFSGGSGTAGDPYKVSNVADLAELDSLVNVNNAKGKFFKLTCDIATPVTRMVGSEGVFSGHFDGEGHTINLAIESEESYIGLFGTTTHATIKNLIVEGYIHAGNSVAAVVGNPSSGTLIENVVNYAEVTGKVYVGGVAGQIVSQKKGGSVGVTVRNCVNYGTIHGQSIAGGVVGYSGQQVGNVLERLVNYGHVDGGNRRMGGVVGNPLYNDVVKGLINMGTIGNIEISGVMGNANPTTQAELYYDCQYSPSQAVISSQCKNTAQLLGNAMRSEEQASMFNESYWCFEEGMLPRLKMQGQEHSPRAVLYATPLLLEAGNTVLDVNAPFKVKTDGGVEWKAQNGKVEITSTGMAYPKEVGQEVLMATYKGYSRSIAINITKVSAIDEVKADDRLHGDAWFTVMGVPIQRPTHAGIYIHNGKKVIIP